MNTKPEPEHAILANTKRILAHQKAQEHWLAVGFSYQTALALASAKHGLNDVTREWGLRKMREKTNLREEDLV
jgi:hypothetical protein